MEIIIARFLENKRNRDQIMPVQLSTIKGLFVFLSFKTEMEGGRDQEQIARMLSPVKLSQEKLSLQRADNLVKIILRYC